YHKRFINSDFVNPDYQLLAESFGINHIPISSAQDLDDLFASRDLQHSINLIELVIDRDAFPNYQSRR
ncbi:MAG TPA: hypothetical protein VIN71_09770, partial [Pseudomonadales bacterium]